MHHLFEALHLEFMLDPAWWDQIGPMGVFLYSMVESFFLLPPPEAVLIPLALAFPEKALLYGFLISMGSVVGAAIGYGIGVVGGRPVILWFTRWKVTGKFFKIEHFEHAEKMMQKYGAWAIGIAGFTVVPYKIFTIGGGMVRLPFAMFIFVSILSRSARFMLEAVLIYFLRDTIVEFIKSPMFHLATLALFAGAALGIYFYRKRTRKKAPEAA